MMQYIRLFFFCPQHNRIKLSLLNLQTSMMYILALFVVIVHIYKSTKASDTVKTWMSNVEIWILACTVYVHAFTVYFSFTLAGQIMWGHQIYLNHFQNSIHLSIWFLKTFSLQLQYILDDLLFIIDIVCWSIITCWYP